MISVCASVTKVLSIRFCSSYNTHEIQMLIRQKERYIITCLPWALYELRAGSSVADRPALSATIPAPLAMKNQHLDQGAMLILACLTAPFIRVQHISGTCILAMEMMLASRFWDLQTKTLQCFPAHQVRQVSRKSHRPWLTYLQTQGTTADSECPVATSSSGRNFNAQIWWQ